ncbi:MAG: hypothetical protein AABX38_02765 [Candidatus Micrarchaeota archaeon]
MKRYFLLILLIISLYSFGCFTRTNAEPAKNQVNQSANTTLPVGGMSFTVISPKNEQIIKTNSDYTDVIFYLSTINLNIVPAGPKNTPGNGHFDIYVDGLMQKKVFSKTFTLKNLEQGKHNITIEFVNINHSSYNPKITQNISLEITQGGTRTIIEEVIIRDFEYLPSIAYIKAGDVVSWINKGNSPRSITSTNNFDSGIIPSDAEFARKFDEKGEYTYFSINYPLMQGKIVVE